MCIVQEAAEGAEAGRMEMGAECGSVGAWERESVGAWEGHLPAGINRIGERNPRSTLTSQKLCDCFCPRPHLKLFVHTAYVGVTRFVADANLLGASFVETPVAD